MGCNCGGSAKAARQRRVERLQKRREVPANKPVDRTAGNPTYWTGPKSSEKS